MISKDSDDFIWEERTSRYSIGSELSLIFDGSHSGYSVFVDYEFCRVLFEGEIIAEFGIKDMTKAKKIAERELKLKIVLK